jgi:para-aminobenzoate synthetase/4-amino-4-deoxychorismate lyase
MNFTESTIGRVICRLPGLNDAGEVCFGEFSSPIKILKAKTIEDVIPVINEVEKSLSKGYYVAGYLTYEAGRAFDAALKTRDLDSEPYAWFGIYTSVKEFCFLDEIVKNSQGLNFKPSIEKAAYINALKRVKDYIYNGDIYQANYTFKSIFKDIKSLPIDLYDLFIYLMKEHPVPYGVYLNTGDSQIVSLSPELFFEKNGSRIISSPMKGTAARKLSYFDDINAGEELAKDSKNCAENLMIVDMVRNDLGRICQIGSVKVESLFKIKTFRTVHQMVSDISGKLRKNISLCDILKALFPAASITGAPKVRAMEIINELEVEPRKVYTGSIGCFLPKGDMCLNVAIRTILGSDKDFELGIGSGIVADSLAESEWNECILKSSFSKLENINFDLLETILWQSGKGFVLLEEHCERLHNSCKYLQWKCSKSSLKNELYSIFDKGIANKKKNYRVRLLFSLFSGIRVECFEIQNIGWNTKCAKVYISSICTSSDDFFLYHKTTNRGVYDIAFRNSIDKGFDEVLFMNEKGELTEGAISNIFILLGGIWYTPELGCGLLPGIWRQKMIKEFNACEKVLFLEDLYNADKVFIGNSVRGGVFASIVN